MFVPLILYINHSKYIYNYHQSYGNHS